MARCFPVSLAHSSLEIHCSYRLKFFVAKNHLRSSSPSNCSLLSSRFARSCSTRPSQRFKYTEGVALRMRCIAVKRLSRKCVQKKIRPSRVYFFGRTFDFGHDQAKRLPKRLQFSGIATMGHAGARALATRGRAPPVQS